MSNTIFDVLDYGRIVKYDEDGGLLVTYNGHATYNLWVEDFHHTFENVDVATVYPEGNGENTEETTQETARRLLADYYENE